MTVSTARLDALEKRVEELFTRINDCPTHEELKIKLESALLRIDALEKRSEYLLAVVARVSGSEGEPIKLEAIQNSTNKSKGKGVAIEFEAYQHPKKSSQGKSVPIELNATKKPIFARNAQLRNSESKIREVEAVASRMEDLKEKLKSISASRNSLKEFVDISKVDDKENGKFFQGELQELRGKVNVLMKAVSNLNGGHGVGKIEIPMPKAFNGACDAEDVGNFLFDMDMYFNATNYNSDEGRLEIVPMFLKDNAKLWWRTKKETTIFGQCTIASWDDFKKELRARFYPENVARRKLNEIQQTGPIREYVKEFSVLMLDINNMTPSDRLFYFLRGLKPWAQRELLRRNLKDLSAAVDAANSLYDYSHIAHKRKFNLSQV
ncbi:uncharacterized protein LOC110607301 [Manihot esculenta]|uniref:Uncharacterized protein n=1 Tax=Manihot esculenta TaxID=3983 RepID=A0ACB7GDS0_MANES|nr:uncharacterized protein LOC110607301 [Manihot esculenta]KAG8638146.1 hypothetical protein MANES_15G192966v8 [Manihot esculenta]